MKLETPEISVVIPVYNCEKYIDSTVQDLLKQTFQDFEIIFVNDGSTDNTLKILESYKDSHPEKISIFTQKNSGPGVARNNGIKHARGKFLALLDADDVFDQKLLESAHQKIVEDQADVVVYGSDEYLSAEGKCVPAKWTINQAIIPDYQPFAGSDIKENIFTAFVGWPWDKLYRTEFVRENNLEFQDLRSSEDALFVFMSIIKAKRISILPKVLVHHRLVEGSVSHTRETNWESFYKALLAIRDELQKSKFYERYERDFINYALNFSLWHLTTLCGSAYEKLYDKLKTSWWQELGVEDHAQDKAYFYDERDFIRFELVKKSSPCEFQCYLREEVEHNLSMRDAEIYQMVQSTTWKLGRIMMLPVRIVKKLLHR